MPRPKLPAKKQAKPTAKQTAKQTAKSTAKLTAKSTAKLVTKPATQPVTKKELKGLISQELQKIINAKKGLKGLISQEIQKAINRSKPKLEPTSSPKPSEPGLISGFFQKHFGPDYAKTLKTGLLEGFALAPGLFLGEMALSKAFGKESSLDLLLKNKLSKIAAQKKKGKSKGTAFGFGFLKKLKLPSLATYGLIGASVAMPTYFLIKSIGESKKANEIANLQYQY